MLAPSVQAVARIERSSTRGQARCTRPPTGFPLRSSGLRLSIACGVCLSSSGVERIPCNRQRKAMSPSERVVAIEEHFWIPELRDRYSGPRGISAHTPARQLDDLGEIRLAEMDAAGIDMQVISHMQPGTQIFDAETAITLARKANDVLYAST